MSADSATGAARTDEVIALLPSPLNTMQGSTPCHARVNVSLSIPVVSRSRLRGHAAGPRVETYGVDGQPTLRSADQFEARSHVMLVSWTDEVW